MYKCLDAAAAQVRSQRPKSLDGPGHVPFCKTSCSQTRRPACSLEDFCVLTRQQRIKEVHTWVSSSIGLSLVALHLTMKGSHESRKSAPSRPRRLGVCSPHACDNASFHQQGYACTRACSRQNAQEANAKRASRLYSMYSSREVYASGLHLAQLHTLVVEGSKVVAV